MEESPVKPKAEQAGSDISVEDNGQKPEKGKNLGDMNVVHLSKS